MGNDDSAQTLRGSPTVSTARDYGREMCSVGERIGIRHSTTLAKRASRRARREQRRFERGPTLIE